MQSCSLVLLSVVGPINSLIYPVEGGMEDWLYAAGWDKGPLRECGTAAAAGQRPRARVLAAEDTDHNEHQAEEKELHAHRALAEKVGENRAVVFLVETSDRKKPQENTLGGSFKVLHVFFFLLVTFSLSTSMHISVDSGPQRRAEWACAAQCAAQSGGHRHGAAVRLLEPSEFGTADRAASRLAQQKTDGRTGEWQWTSAPF